VYSKIKIAGHPVHPMLVAFPVAWYTGTLAGFAVYAANGHLFWLDLAPPEPAAIGKASPAEDSMGTP
jgi:uncharacterized membrane protein